MEEVNKKEQVLKELSQEVGTEVKLQDFDKIVRVQYEVMMTQSNDIMKRLSARNIIRAILNAIDLPVESGLAPSFVKKEEAELAGLLAQLLDRRNLIQAKILREQEENKENKNVETNA